MRSGYIERARQLLGPVEHASPELPALVDIAEVIANGPTGFTRAATTDAQLAAIVTVARSQEQWASVLRNLMPQDLTASYLWLGSRVRTVRFDVPGSREPQRRAA